MTETELWRRDQVQELDSTTQFRFCTEIRFGKVSGLQSGLLRNHTFFSRSGSWLVLLSQRLLFGGAAAPIILSEQHINKCHCTANSAGVRTKLIVLQDVVQPRLRGVAIAPAL